MRVLLVALVLMGAPAEKPTPATPQKGAPTHPKKKRVSPPHPPAGAPRTDKPKTAMA